MSHSTCNKFLSLLWAGNVIGVERGVKKIILPGRAKKIELHTSPLLFGNKLTEFGGMSAWCTSSKLRTFLDLVRKNVTNNPWDFSRKIQRNEWPKALECERKKNLCKLNFNSCLEFPKVLFDVLLSLLSIKLRPAETNILSIQLLTLGILIRLMTDDDTQHMKGRV